MSSNADKDSRGGYRIWVAAFLAVVVGLAIDTAIALLTDYTPQLWFAPVASMHSVYGIPLFFDSPGITVTFGYLMLQLVTGDFPGGVQNAA